MSLNPIQQLNIITIVSIMVLFVINYFVLRKLFFDPYINTMEKRHQKIEESKKLQAEARGMKEEAREKANNIVEEAKAKAEQVSSEMKEKIAAIRQDKHEVAKVKADEILAKGRKQIKTLKESEMEKLNENLFYCVRKALIKLVGEVDDSTVHLTVNKVLASKKVGK